MVVLLSFFAFIYLRMTHQPLDSSEMCIVDQVFQLWEIAVLLS